MNILRRHDVAKKFGVTPTTIDRWVRDKLIIQPFYIGTQVPMWDEDDIERMIKQKKQGGSNGTSSDQTESN